VPASASGRNADRRNDLRTSSACSSVPLLLRNAGFQLPLGHVMSMLFVVLLGNLDFFGRYAGIQAIPAPDPISIQGLFMIKFDNKLSCFYLILRWP
jgi:hypothetical protein